MSNDHLLIVASNPVPGREAEFSTWYDSHVRDSVRRFPGFIAGRRYSISDNQSAPFNFSHLAIYRIAHPHLAAAQQRIVELKAERAAAIAAGREPIHPASPSMASPHYGWYFSPVGEGVGPWFDDA